MTPEEQKTHDEWIEIARQSFQNGLEAFAKTPEGKAAILELLCGNKEPIEKWAAEHRQASLDLMNDMFEGLNE